MGDIKDRFRQSMSRLASGVSVVTTSVDGRPWGVTISACYSVSMNPPLLLISLSTETASTYAILEQQQFGVSILDQNQVDVAIAGSNPGEPKFFEEYVYSDKSAKETYIVKNSMDHFHCVVYDTLVAGDHTIFIGLVKNVINGHSNLPLLYSQREFGTFSYY